MARATGSRWGRRHEGGALVSVVRIRARGGTRDCTVLFTGGGSRTSKSNQRELDAHPCEHVHACVASCVISLLLSISLFSRARRPPQLQSATSQQHDTAPSATPAAYLAPPPPTHLFNPALHSASDHRQARQLRGEEHECRTPRNNRSAIHLSLEHQPDRHRLFHALLSGEARGRWERKGIGRGKQGALFVGIRGAGWGAKRVQPLKLWPRWRELSF